MTCLIFRLEWMKQNCSIRTDGMEWSTDDCPALNRQFICSPFIHLSQHCFFSPIQVEKSSTSIHLKFQSALAVGGSDLLSPSTVDLRSHFEDFSYPKDLLPS
ncbi:hypothetical protein AVEN_122008-1 [Araneus ventricosus]|uniref:Uncharacterized protein n=1 Tax=Araneus ventricosus TaxID=182803 RepID=A0A4Y2RBP9_ARAVE|nr:hypothetical protein AVEN_122008-1 [Araneus ventricosus]